MDSISTQVGPIIKHMPSAFRESIAADWERFVERLSGENLFFPEDPDFLNDLIRVWSASRFVTDYCVRNPAALLDLYRSGALKASDRAQSYRNDLAGLEIQNEADLMRVLRGFRNREMVRIAWRDISGQSAVNETLMDCSLLAEACLDRALEFLYQEACRRFGEPVSQDGTAQRLVVLGMGKFGAWELNFSSDIDLIFAFEEDGVLPGKKEKTHGEFFNTLAKSLVRVIDQVTSEGFVFRVDLRLRPFGESGPLVMSFNAMEIYYQRQAREWERYAFIKARTVAGDRAAGARLEALLKPFVYRRYLDYGSFSELRNLKSRITQELQQRDRLDNIKLGPGGIREIEFIGQAFQLIRGGHDPALQERGIQKALAVIGAKSLLPQSVVERLLSAYEFLRRVENRLQEYQDRQVHDLPEDEVNRLRLAISLGFADWDQAKRKIDRVRAQVHEVFEQVFMSPQSDSGEGDADLLWAGSADRKQLIEALARIGYRDRESLALDIIEQFRKGYTLKKITASGAVTLDRLMPLLLGAAGRTSNPENTLKKILGLLESIASRRTYLTLLVENPMALSQLVKLAAASSWIVDFIGQSPILLDELLDPRTLYAPSSKQALQDELKQAFGLLAGEDLERKMARLREFKQAQVLRIAAADIAGAIEVSTVSDYLSDLAEVVLEKALDLAWNLLVEKHGTPAGAAADRVSGFAIIAYGKLGGRELGYGSDLDLVYLHAGADLENLSNGSRPITGLQFYARLGQRVINLLDTKMLSGVLYEVDMRLRPSGRSGFLVSHIDAFEHYQSTQAWTWEHQALVRARFVAGDEELAGLFAAVRAKALSARRDPETLRTEVREMRAKMRENLASRDRERFDLKQGVGGIADIEFIVQFGVLLHAHQNPNLLKFTDTVRLLKILPETGLLSDNEAEALENAYFEYRNLGHRAALKERPALVSDHKLNEVRTRIEKIWLRLME